MKINFSREVTFTPTWRGNDQLPEGEKITSKLTVMNIQDFIEAVEFISSAKGTATVDEKTLVQTKGLLEAAQKLLPKYVKIVNLLDENGADLSTEVVVSNATLLNLTAELFMKLVEISQPSDIDVKN